MIGFAHSEKTERSNTLDHRPETYDLETVEQLKAIADPLRLRMIGEVTRKQMTVTQVGEVVGVPANKAHYHMRELERVGLVRIVETREKSGILEKYYMTVARDLNVPRSLLQQVSADDSIAAANELTQSVMRNFMDAFAKATRAQTATSSVSIGAVADVTRSQAWASTIMLDYNDFWMSQDEWRDATREIKEVLKPFQKRDESGERRQMTFLLLTHPVAEGVDSAEATGPTGTTPHPMPTGFDERARGDDRPHSSSTKGLIIESGDGHASNKRRRVIAAGAIGYSRADLERLVEAGEQLDLNILGALSFTSNVTPELVERTISRVRHRGVINASSAVKAVLKRKGAKVPE
jgi:DNA-binding transcriptional ArsR family regulator